MMSQQIGDSVKLVVNIPGYVKEQADVGKGEELGIPYWLVYTIANGTPFTAEQKTGRWIDDKCSVCGKGTEDLISSREWYRNEEPNFCPFCGLKLVDPQESEEE